MQDDEINARVEAEVQRRLAGGGAAPAPAPTPAAGNPWGGGFTPAPQAVQPPPGQPVPTHLSFCIKFQMPDGSESRGYLHFPVEGIHPQMLPQFAVQISQLYPIERHMPRQQGGYGNQGGYGGTGGGNYNRGGYNNGGRNSYGRF